jgi:peptide/nickel transport system permease protein
VGAYIIRRLFGILLVLLAVSLIVYLIFIVIPGGNPALRIAGRTATQANILDIKHRLGLDKHGFSGFFIQWYRLVKQLFTAKLISYYDGTNVVQQIKDGLPVTFSLSIGAGIIWQFWGIMVGIISAVTAGRLSDRLITVLALIGISMPVFWLGLILRYFLAEGHPVSIFPDGEYVGLTQNPVQWFYHLMLPWFCLAVLFIGFYGRVLRSNILDAINEDFVRTARAKGLAPRRVLIKHVLRNSLIPIATLFGLDFAAVVGGGAILTETVFNLHGVGQYAADSINSLDLPPIIGVTLFGAFFIVLFNALVDFLYAYLDPRIRPA